MMGEMWGQGKGVRLSGSLGLGADSLQLKRVDSQLRGYPQLLENAGCAHMRTCDTHAVTLHQAQCSALSSAQAWSTSRQQRPVPHGPTFHEAAE